MVIQGKCLERRARVKPSAHYGLSTAHPIVSLALRVSVDKIYDSTKKKKEKKKSGKAASPSVVTSEIPTVGRKDSREVITDPINSIIREEKGTKRSGGDCFLMFSWGIERDQRHEMG